MRLFARSGFVRSVLNLYRPSGNEIVNCFRKSIFTIIKRPVRYPLEVNACFYSTDGKKSFIGLDKKGIKDAIELKKEQFEQKLRLKGEEIVKDFRYQKDVTGERLRLKKESVRLKKESVIKDILEAKSKVKDRIEDVVEKEKILTIPNVLCLARIAMTPYLGYVIIQNEYHLALALLVFAGITDLLDGWIARKWKGQSSRIGSFLDPLADKVLISTLFVTLTWQNLIPLELTLLIVSRDIALVIAGFVIRYKSLPPPRTLSRYFDATNATAQLAPTFISKVNTAVQLILVGTTLASPVFGYVDHPALQVLFGVTAASTIVSAVSYIVSKDTYKFLKIKS